MVTVIYSKGYCDKAIFTAEQRKGYCDKVFVTVP